MPSLPKKQQAARHTAAGRRLIKSVNQAIAWSKKEKDPIVQVTAMSGDRAPLVDVKLLRERLALSQSQFASRFGFTLATVKNWEQGRTRPDGPAKTLLAVIAHNPRAVDAALRKAS